VAAHQKASTAASSESASDNSEDGGQFTEARVQQLVAAARESAEAQLQSIREQESKLASEAEKKAASNESKVRLIVVAVSHRRFFFLTYVVADL